MLNLATGASPLEILLREAGGVQSAVLGTMDGEVRAATAEAAPGEELAAVTAAVSRELAIAGELLGLGGFSSVTVKATTSARVYARQGSATLALAVDPRQPLGELEARLRDGSWQLREATARTASPPPPPPPRSGGATRRASDGGTGEAPAMPVTGLAATGSRPTNRAIIPAPAPRAMRGPQAPIPNPAPAQTAVIAAPPPSDDSAVRQRPAVITRPRPVAADGSTREKLNGGESVFTGQLEEFPLADLLVFMRNGVRTGLLTCVTEEGTGSIQLCRGLITGASSPRSGGLREHLLAKPDLTATQRFELTVLPPECFLDDVVEQALLPHSLVSLAELAAAREARIYAAFREMLNWKEGRFSFEPSAPPAREPSLELTAQSVILQVFREQDEQGR